MPHRFLGTEIKPAMYGTMNVKLQYVLSEIFAGTGACIGEEQTKSEKKFLTKGGN
jgi:hypothetical protein